MAALGRRILVAVAVEQVKPVLLEVLDLVATEVTDPLMFIKQDPVKHMLAVAAVVVIPDLADLVELAAAVPVVLKTLVAVMAAGTLAAAEVAVLLPVLPQLGVD